MNNFTPVENGQHSATNKAKAFCLSVLLAVGFYAAIFASSHHTGEFSFLDSLFTSEERRIANAVTASLIGMVIFCGLVLAGVFLSGNASALASLFRGVPFPGWIAAGITATAHISVSLVFFITVPERISELSVFNLYVSSVTALGGGALEEFVYRGLIMMLLLRAGFSSVSTILISALLFALPHLGWVPLSELSPETVFLQLSPIWGTFILGVALGFTFLQSRCRLWAVFAAHGAINLVLEPWLLLSFLG